MNLAAPVTVTDELEELIVDITRHNVTLPYEIRDRLKSIELRHKEKGEKVTYEQLDDAFKILLSEADDPNAPARIALLIRRDYLPE